MRGYDRHAVDDFVAELLALVADLESHQTREGVVQKALGELGEETAGILQRAHETADDITSRSRAQADARLQRAEREAEIVRRDADDYSEQVIVDTRLLWEERQRLIEDIRQLADEVLGTADDAMERVKLPEPLARRSRGRPPAELPADQLPRRTRHRRRQPSTPTSSAPRGRPSRERVKPARSRRLGRGSGSRPTPRTPQRRSGHTAELEALPGGCRASRLGARADTTRD